MTKRRVFLSFKMEDKQQVNGLRLLVANPNFDVEFFDESVRQAIDSEQAPYIKRKVQEKISRTSVTVCLIGKNTHASKWVEWELEQSFKKGNKVIAMALKGVDRAILPKPIKEADITFYPWNIDNLARLINA